MFYRSLFVQAMFKNKCHHYIGQNNYCSNCKRASIFVEDVDKVDCVERGYDDKLNEDYVTAFLTVDDNDANMNTAANTMISIACTTLCNVLLSYIYNVPEYINNIMLEDFAIPLIDHMDDVINDSSRSIFSRLS